MFATKMILCDGHLINIRDMAWGSAFSHLE